MLLAGFLWALGIAGNPDYHELPEWKAYQSRVAPAFAIEVRWTEKEYSQGRLGDKTKPDVVRSLHVKCMKPDNLWFEEVGARRVVWNGKDGLDLDMKSKTFTRLKKLPECWELYWLDLPQCPDPQRTTSGFSSVKSSKERVGKDDLACLTATVHEIDFARVWAFYLDPRTHLIRFWDFRSYGMGPHRELLRTVTSFDLTPLLIRSDFALDVPAGFSEKLEKPSVTTDGKEVLAP